MDIFVGLFFIFLSSALLILSQQMPIVEHLGPFAAPGLLPTIVSVVILLLALLLTGKNTYRIFKEWRLSEVVNWASLKGTMFKGTDISFRENMKALIVLAIIVFYILLLGRIDYSVATLMFLTVFMFVFKALSWYKIIIISIVFTIAVTKVFSRIFLIPLP